MNEKIHTWLSFHVEIPAEHPVCMHIKHGPKLPTIANYMYMYQAYEQMNKVLQWHWEPMTICQYRCHNIIHVNAWCFSLRQKFETVSQESTGHHHEEAFSLQPRFMNEVKCFHEIMTGMGNP